MSDEQDGAVTPEELEQRLRERVKELTCLYELSRMVENVERPLGETVELLLPKLKVAWRAPEETTCVRIKVGDEVWQTEDFVKPVAVQTAAIPGDDRWPVGEVAVGYLEPWPLLDEGPFLHEERFLINTVARALGNLAKRQRVLEEIQAANQQLEASNQQLRANEQQLQAANQQLRANEQQLQAANQQLRANEQQLQAANQQLRAHEQQLEAANLEVRASEARYRGVLNSLDSGVVVHAADTSIVLANPRACEILGLTLGQMEGKEAIDPQWQFTREDDTTLPLEEYPVMKVLSRGTDLRTMVVGVYRPQHKDKVWVLVNGHPMYNDEGVVEQAIISFTDITRQKVAEEQKHRLQAQLLQAQKMEAIGTLAGGVAHDFNNIITVIKSNVEIALEDEGGDLEAMDEIKEAAQRAGELTRQLLLYSQKQPMNLEPLSLNEVVLVFSSMIRRIIGEDVALHSEFGANLWGIKADRGNLEQVLMNLAVNARDAMADGGDLFVCTSNLTLDEADAALHAEGAPGEYVLLEMRDTGEGIPEDVLERVFEPFYTTKKAGRGTGLGLSVVYGIVQEHGGWIEVTSAEGEGATFRIFIPRTRKKSAAPARVKQLTPENLGLGERILLVEDDPPVLATMTRILDRHGYQVTVATTVAEAEALFAGADEPIDLLLSDVILPDGSGLDMAVKLAGENPELKVLVASGYPGDRFGYEELKKQGLPFIQKPFELGALVGMVRQILDGKA